MAMNMDAVLKIRAKVDGLRKVDQLGRAIGGVERRATALTSGIGGLVGGFGALSGALTALAAGGALKSVMDTFGAYQADILALERGLQNLGNNAPAYLEPLKQLASDLGEQTLFNEEDFNKGFALLTSFGNIGVEQYGRVARAASDVAQISGTDVQAAMMQLAKALNAPSQGVAALARSGIQFTDAQKAVVKELEKTGQIAKAQELIFKELEKQYGGASVAAAGGFAGALDTMGEKIYDVQKAMGPMIEEALTPFVATITKGADVLGNDLLPAINNLPGPVKVFAGAVVGLTGAFVGLKFAMQGVIALTQTAMWASLLAAGPWIALAAGITAAVYALASYRSEAEKLAGAAAAGGAPAVAAARNMAVQKGQEISLLERQRQSAQGREKASIDRRLAVLRRERDELLASARSGDRSTGGAVPLPDGEQAAAGGGGGGGSKAAANAKRADDAAKKEAERVQALIRDRMAEAELMKLKSEIQDRIAAAEQDGDAMLAARLRGQEREIEIQYRYAQQLAAENDLRAQQAIIYQGNVALVANQREIERDLSQLQLEADQRRFNALQQLAEKQYEMNTAVQNQLQLADGIANTLGQGMTSAFDGLISGAENWGESLRQIAAGALQDIANQLIRIFVIEQAISAIKTFLTPFSPSTPLGAGGGQVGKFGTLGPNYGIPQRANGGPVQMGTPYLIGERGPELFVPGRSGTVIPNTGGTNVTVNVDASGTTAQGDSQQANQLGRVIGAAVQAELIKQKRPGGLLAT
jgi:hypothetical protein